MKIHLASLTAIALLATSGALPAAAKIKSIPNPDFTKGEKIPEGAKHDWNLGATGARGWMYVEKMVTNQARQIAITKVEKGTPAEGVLATGDVILGVGGKPFSHDPRTEFGRALTIAESETGGGNLKLTRWRDGKTEQVVVKLPVLGTYSATAPYNCPKSSRILVQGCRDLAGRMADPNYEKKTNPIPRSLNALALLASGEPDYLPLLKKEAEWAGNFSAESMATWYYGYVMMFLAEYKMATGDESVMPGLKRLALEAARGQSAVGSWGHKFARPDGRLFGYGMMNAPGVPLTSAMAMARMAGVKDPALDLAIERSAKLLRFYIGKGAIPYGDHHPWIQTHEDNGKCGMVAVMFNLIDEPKGAEFFSRMSVASHGSERDCGHTGNFFNVLWATPGVNLSGSQASGAWMNEFGAWYFDLARGATGNFVHLGPPEIGNDAYAGWDASGAYLLAYAMPLKKIVLTGKKASTAPQLDAKTAEALIRDGRGWNNRDRTSAYDMLNQEQLLEMLGSWSPTVRERAASALSRRKEGPPVDALVKMLASPRLEARYGACDALLALKAAAAPAVPELVKLLDHQDLWMRVKAAETLAGIGEPGVSSLPILLKRLAQTPAADDPRGMEQRYLCFNVFGIMLKKSIDGVDRALLGEAVAAGLQNQDGRARGSIGGIYGQLTYEEIKPLLPAIRRAIAEPAPSGEMFAAGIRLDGLDILAKHRIKEGMELCFHVMELDQWGKGNRVPRCLKALAAYGAAAKPMLPRLRELEKEMVANGMTKELPVLAETIKKIENATGDAELRTLE
ncbi:MAG: DUF6288 domain-containing protein [Verrucomicrobiales bacterium]